PDPHHEDRGPQAGEDRGREPAPWQAAQHPDALTALPLRQSSERGRLDLFRPARHMLGIMNHERYDDSYIRGILNTVKTIAMVGASAKDNRPSYFAFKYLAGRGYNMIPINPGLSGKELLGRTIYGRLAEV